jgi:hypothetical protein
MNKKLVRSMLVTVFCFILNTYLAKAQTPSLTGYYSWTWNANATTALAKSNLSICFSGLTSVKEVLASCKSYKAAPGSQKYISFGGGNYAGRWTQSILTSIDKAANANSFTGWSGIVYDIGEGDKGLTNAFASSFKNSKAKGLKVFVTVSYSQPYLIGTVADANALMMSFLSNANIDFISPQLYTSGTETQNSYTVLNGGVPWSAYAKSRAKVVPSLVIGSRDYLDAVNKFRTYGVSLFGYVQWSQCMPLWYNYCHSNSECCSNNCDTNKGAWRDGVCKP